MENYHEITPHAIDDPDTSKARETSEAGTEFNIFVRRDELLRSILIIITFRL